MTDVPAWVPIAAAVGAATIGAGAALIAGWQRARIERRHRIESESKEQRVSVYQRLAEALRHGERGSTNRERNTLAVDIGLFGSDEVVRAWVAYVDAVHTGALTKESAENLRHVGTVLLAMRRDASRPNSTLKAVDVLACLGLREGRSRPPERLPDDTSG